MKVDLKQSLNLHPHSQSESGGIGPRGRHLTNTTMSVYNTEQNNERIKITTTASDNACGRLSFKGSKEVKVTNGMRKFANKLLASDFAQKVLTFTKKNSMLAEAIFALGITCGLRPGIILASPGKGEDKEKNKYAAAHSIASGLIGLGSTLILVEPIKRAADKIIKTEPAVSKELVGDALKNALSAKSIRKDLLGRVYNPVLNVLRATATIALIPPILNAFGITKSSSKGAKHSAQESNFAITHQEQKNVFKSFAGVNKNENK